MEAFEQLDPPDIDRDYMFAVMVYLLPGFLTRLLRSASARHIGQEQQVDNNVNAGAHRENVLQNAQGFAPGHNNKALRNLQRAFGLVEARNIQEIDRDTHRLDGHVKATKQYCCVQVMTALNRTYR